MRESTARATESVLVPQSTRTTRAAARASIQVSQQPEQDDAAPVAMEVEASAPATVVKTVKGRKGLADQTNGTTETKSPSPKKKATKASPKAKAQTQPQPQASQAQEEVTRPSSASAPTKPEPKKKASPKKKAAQKQQIQAQAQAQAQEPEMEAISKKNSTPEKAEASSEAPGTAKKATERPRTPATPEEAKASGASCATPSTVVRGGTFIPRAGQVVNESTVSNASSVASMEISALKTKRLVKDAVARMETPGKETRPVRKTRSKDRLLKEIKASCSVADLANRIQESISNSSSSAPSHEVRRRASVCVCV